MPLINCKIHLDLNWSKDCVMYGTNEYDAVDDANNDTIFKIISTRLYVPIATLSTKDNVNLTKQLTERFKRSVYWNEYKSKIETKTADKRNITRFSLDASFQGVNRLFLLLLITLLRMMLKFQLVILLIEFKETDIENISS